ncbi:F0F1 ATP synthase subunit epsilon, partial [Patescibacteria group bacterium]
DVKRVIAPGVIQDIAILPDHTPLYSELKKGEVEIIITNNKTEKIPINGGIIRVKLNKVSIIEGF